MKTFEPMAGTSITSAIRDALAVVTDAESCTFEFNGTSVTVNHNDDPRAIEEKWSQDMETAQVAYLASPEYAEAQARREREATQSRLDFAAQVEPLKTLDEKGLRELDLKWPYTIEELNSLIVALTERQHDYGTCVYAMSLAATAAFYYVAHSLGTTSFQSSCADLDILRRTRSLDSPFAIIKAQDMLYPQYDILAKVHEHLGEWMPWAAKQAQELLSKNGGHPEVRARWEEIVDKSVVLAALKSLREQGAEVTDLGSEGQNSRSVT